MLDNVPDTLTLAELQSVLQIGKNTAIVGITTAEDYPDGILESGEILNKEGEME